MHRLILKPREERRLLRGHLWAYRNEFATAPDLPDGTLTDVYAPGGRFVARGFYQAEGGIAVRLLTRRQTGIDAAFIENRLTEALALRERLFPGETTYRWVFGESDGLPGLIVDRYGATAHAMSSCAFYREQSEAVVRGLMRHAGVAGVRCEWPGGVETAGDAPNDVEVVMEGLTYQVDLAGGQKTGLFLDQRVNARMMRTLAPGARVFDGHCYAGMWSMEAARAGATETVGVDSSQRAIAAATANAARNGLDARTRFVCGDVMETLQATEAPYDVVLLDPPAWAKTRGAQGQARTLHQALHRAAFGALKPGGFMVTSTCSHHLDPADFVESIKRAARDVQRDALILETAGAAPDHPVLLAMPETRYLTCVALRAS